MYILKLMIFEWDEAKFKSNHKKHGISFLDACLVFYDFNAVYFEDDKHSKQESRVNVIGHSPKGLLFVVYIVKTKSGSYRIISARKASKKEKFIYEEAQR